MDNATLLQTIKGDASLQALANAGSDDLLAQKINATLPKAVPITVPALQKAAPTTLAAIASGANPLSEMEVIASRVRANDAAGVGSWASTLAMLGKMPPAELTAVEALVAAAANQDSVDHTQVTAVLEQFRKRTTDLIETDENGKPVLDAKGQPIIAQPIGTVIAQPINWSAI